MAARNELRFSKAGRMRGRELHTLLQSSAQSRVFAQNGFGPEDTSGSSSLLFLIDFLKYFQSPPSRIGLAGLTHRTAKISKVVRLKELWECGLDLSKAVSLEGSFQTNEESQTLLVFRLFSDYLLSVQHLLVPQAVIEKLLASHELLTGDSQDILPLLKLILDPVQGKARSVFGATVLFLNRVLGNAHANHSSAEELSLSFSALLFPRPQTISLSLLVRETSQLAAIFKCIVQNPDFVLPADSADPVHKLAASLPLLAAPAALPASQGEEASPPRRAQQSAEKLQFNRAWTAKALSNPHSDTPRLEPSSSSSPSSDEAATFSALSLRFEEDPRMRAMVVRLQSLYRRQLARKRLKLLKVERELLTTEASYLETLKVLKHHFYCGIVDAGVLSASELATVFSPIIVELVEWHQLLYGILVGKSQRNESLAQSFAEQSTFLRFYDAYVINFTGALELLTAKRQDPSFSKALAALEKCPVCRSLDLPSFLIAPVQRIPRYLLFMREMMGLDWVSRCKCLEALHKLESITVYINEFERQHKSAQRLQALRFRFEAESIPFELPASPRCVLNDTFFSPLDDDSSPVELVLTSTHLIVSSSTLKLVTPISKVKSISKIETPPDAPPPKNRNAKHWFEIHIRGDPPTKMILACPLPKTIMTWMKKISDMNQKTKKDRPVQPLRRILKDIKHI